MLTEAQIGVKNADGSHEREAQLCAVSGRPVLGFHCALINLDATKFIRVLSENHSLVTEEWLEAARAAIAAPSPASKSKKDKPEEMTDGN